MRQLSELFDASGRVARIMKQRADWPEEANVRINGRTLSLGESMTLRVAIEHYVSYLHDNGLGEDSHGKAMTKGYLVRLDDIRSKLYSR